MSMVIPAIRENVPLAPMTTLGVGGPARYLLYAADPDELRHRIEPARPKVCEHRHPCPDPREVLELQPHAGSVGDRE
jgi:hypothetical protein